jgi:hypothetical protein
MHMTSGVMHVHAAPFTAAVVVIVPPVLRAQVTPFLHAVHAKPVQGTRWVTLPVPNVFYARFNQRTLESCGNVLTRLTRFSSAEEVKAATLALQDLDLCSGEAMLSRFYDEDNGDLFLEASNEVWFFGGLPRPCAAAVIMFDCKSSHNGKVRKTVTVQGLCSRVRGAGRVLFERIAKASELTGHSMILLEPAGAVRAVYLTWGLVPQILTPGVEPSATDGNLVRLL